jgi:hypothetical protein
MKMKEREREKERDWLTGMNSKKREAGTLRQGRIAPRGELRSAPHRTLEVRAQFGLLGACPSHSYDQG